MICEFPLSELLAFHKSHNREGTIFVNNKIVIKIKYNLKVTEVKDPSRYGVILYEESGKINNFIEKP